MGMVIKGRHNKWFHAGRLVAPSVADSLPMDCLDDRDFKPKDSDVVLLCNGARIPAVDILRDRSAHLKPRHMCMLSTEDLNAILLLQKFPTLQAGGIHRAFNVAPLERTDEEYRPQQDYDQDSPGYRVRFNAKYHGVDLPNPSDPCGSANLWHLRRSRLAGHRLVAFKALRKIRHPAMAGRPCIDSDGRRYIGLAPGELEAVISSKMRSPGPVYAVMGVLTYNMYMKSRKLIPNISQAFCDGCPLPDVADVTAVADPLVDKNTPEVIYLVNRQYGALCGQGPVYGEMCGSGLARIEESFEYTIVDNHIEDDGYALPDGPTALKLSPDGSS